MTTTLGAGSSILRWPPVPRGARSPPLAGVIGLDGLEGAHHFKAPELVWQPFGGERGTGTGLYLDVTGLRAGLRVIKRDAARGEGGPYRQSIQVLLAEDKAERGRDPGCPEYTSKSGQQYIFVKQRRCAPAPARPKGKPVEWLTVLVTPNNSAEDADPYLIAWQVLPES